MAMALIDDMGGKWNPHQFSDSFKDEIMALVERKAKASQLQPVAQREPPAEEQIPFGAQILDLSDLLQRSLQKSGTSEGVGNNASPKEKPRARALPAKKKKLTREGADDSSPHSPSGNRKTA